VFATAKGGREAALFYLREDEKKEEVEPTAGFVMKYSQCKREEPADDEALLVTPLAFVFVALADGRNRAAV
jgi:hypothetical protein